MTGSAWRWLVDGALWACWGLFGLVWAAGAIYNHKHSPAVRARAGTRDLWLIVAVGIFLLSNFPPTQRFGIFVMFGSATAASAALFMFPWLASVSIHRKKLERKELKAA